MGTQSHTFIQLTDQQHTTIGSNAGALDINLQTSANRELKGLILFLTHWVEPSERSFCSQSRMNTGVGSIMQPLTQSSKRKCGVSPVCALERLRGVLFATP
jgi:hypothetical protein